MECDQDIVRVLTVCCRLSGLADDVEATEVDNATDALHALRRTHFDLLLTGETVCGEAVASLVSKVRRVRPRLCWWLIAGQIDPASERTARTLGVGRILARPPSANDVLEVGRLITQRVHRQPTVAAASDN